MSLSSKTELARALFRSTPPDSVTRISGTATADSADGTVTVQLEDGDVIEVGTIGSVSAGDTVTIHVQRGEAQVIASEGWGDAMQAAVDEATAIAEATGQHFWHDSNGAHVTEITQDQWAQSQTGHNILVNAEGMLLRDALNFLAAFSPSAVTFYDGNGNDASNITAQFGSAGAIIGASGRPRVLVSSDRLSAVNADDALFFDVDYNGAQTTARTSIAAYKVDYVDDGTNQLFDQIDISSAASGTIGMSGITVILPTIYDRVGSVISTSNCTATLNSGSHTVDIVPTVTFIAGTSGSVTATAVLDNLSGPDITVTLVFTYNATDGTLDATIAVADMRLDYITTGSVGYDIVTTAPAFTLGSRQAGGTSGDYSAAIGEGIEAQGDYQTAVGRYNVADSTSALIIGNGTGENARSNAFTVDWSGNVEAAGTIEAKCGAVATSGVATASTGTTISAQEAVKWGGIAQVRLAFTRNSAITVLASGNITDFTAVTLASEYRPKVATAFACPADDAGPIFGTINTDGTVVVKYAESTGAQRTIASGTAFHVSATLVTG